MGAKGYLLHDESEEHKGMATLPSSCPLPFPMVNALALGLSLSPFPDALGHRHMLEMAHLRAQEEIPVLAQKLQEVAKWAKRRTSLLAALSSLPTLRCCFIRVKTGKIKSVRLTAQRRRSEKCGPTAALPTQCPLCHCVAWGPTQAGQPQRPVPCLAKVSGLPYSDLS